jgi:hypothetical protein
MLDSVRRNSRRFSEGWGNILSPKHVMMIKSPVKGKDEEIPIKMKLGDVELNYKNLKWEAGNFDQLSIPIRSKYLTISLLQ